MSEEKLKQNGTEASQRLPSLKPPRDLSLGGVKPKKVFTPNLNVSRNKNKGSSSSTQESKHEDRNRRDRRDRHRTKNGPNVIKSAGVFSEGLGNTERRSTRGPYTRDSSDAAAPQTLQRPTIRVKDFVKIDKELEEQKIKHVMNEAGSEESECYDFRHAREADAPIKLPLDEGGFHRAKKAVVKQEVFVKTEPTDEEDTSPVKSMASLKEDVSDAPDLVNLLKCEEPRIMLMQFPLSLPGRGGAREDEERPRQRDKQAAGAAQPPASADPADTPQVVDNSCCLSDLEEGKIGKLRVYHSGRVTLLLGDTEFEVSMGTQASFHQEVVSVACDDSTRSANIVSLGPLTHKLNIVPDWEKMFTNMNDL